MMINFSVILWFVFLQLNLSANSNQNNPPTTSTQTRSTTSTASRRRRNLYPALPVPSSSHVSLGDPSNQTMGAYVNEYGIRVWLPTQSVLAGMSPDQVQRAQAGLPPLQSTQQPAQQSSQQTPQKPSQKRSKQLKAVYINEFGVQVAHPTDSVIPQDSEDEESTDSDEILEDIRGLYETSSESEDKTLEDIRILYETSSEREDRLQKQQELPLIQSEIEKLKKKLADKRAELRSAMQSQQPVLINQLEFQINTLLDRINTLERREADLTGKISPEDQREIDRLVALDIQRFEDDRAMLEREEEERIKTQLKEQELPLIQSEIEKLKKKLADKRAEYQSAMESQQLELMNQLELQINHLLDGINTLEQRKEDLISKMSPEDQILIDQLVASDIQRLQDDRARLEREEEERIKTQLEEQERTTRPAHSASILEQREQIRKFFENQEREKKDREEAQRLADEAERKMKEAQDDAGRREAQRLADEAEKKKKEAKSTPPIEEEDEEFQRRQLQLQQFGSRRGTLAQRRAPSRPEVVDIFDRPFPQRQTPPSLRYDFDPNRPPVDPFAPPVTEEDEEVKEILSQIPPPGAEEKAVESPTPPLTPFSEFAERKGISLKSVGPSTEVPQPFTSSPTGSAFRPVIPQTSAMSKSPTEILSQELKQPEKQPLEEQPAPIEHEPITASVGVRTGERESSLPPGSRQQTTFSIFPQSRPEPICLSIPPRDEEGGDLSGESLHRNQKSRLRRQEPLSARRRKQFGPYGGRLETADQASLLKTHSDRTGVRPGQAPKRLPIPTDWTGGEQFITSPAPCGTKPTKKSTDSATSPSSTQTVKRSEKSKSPETFPESSEVPVPKSKSTESLQQKQGDASATGSSEHPKPTPRRKTLQSPPPVPEDGCETQSSDPLDDDDITFV